MHLLETYALSTGSKIKKPFIIKKYFPIPFDKYITIQNSSGMPGKCYDYFQEVVNHLFPVLEKENIKIVQIGSKDDAPLKNVINYQGQTNLNQSAYILNNSLLHLGNDSFAVHMASAFKIPLVALYSVSSPEIAGPFWKNDKQICLTPKNWKPSFNPNDTPKRINEIKIEDIINSVELLLFGKSSIKFTTKFIGEKFIHPILECYPDQVIPPNFSPNEMVNIRLDYKTINNLDPIIHNLATRPCCIVTNIPINLDPLLVYRKNLSMLIYDVTDNIDIRFVDYLNNLLIRNAIIFKKTKNNEHILNERKLEMIDLPNMIEEIQIDKNSEFLKDGFTYRTNKILMANNHFYPSKAAAEENKPVNFNGHTLEQDIKLINNKELLKEDLDYFLIYQK
jgi:hypothetical protein